MADRAAKDALYESFAEVARALASGRRAEIVDLLAQGERPVEEIAAEIGQSVANTSHHLRALARARPVPVGELHRYLSALPADADVVAYCRGPYCVRADEAVRELSRRGMRARRLADGFPEWKRAGLPVAAGAREEP